jgi:hypothetical protein
MGGAFLLLADLFLDWSTATVQLAGAIEVETGTSAWGGWGALAGLLLIAFLVLEISMFVGWMVASPRLLSAASIIAIAAAAFTYVEFFTGTTSVTAGAVSISVDERLWPAWLGLVLAAIVAAAAVTRLALQARETAAPPSGRLLTH